MLADANSPDGLCQTRPRLSGAERRLAIVQAAVQLFSQKGFRGTTTRELASAVGVSEPVLYQHFATKKDLYTAIVDHLIAETSSTFQRSLLALGEEYDDRAFFRWLGEQILLWYTAQSSHVRLLFFSALEGHELAQLWHEKAVAEFISWVEDYYRRQASAGAFVPADPQLAARAFIGMIAHFGQTTLLFPYTTLKLSNKEAVDQFVNLFLNGIRTR
jgi:AcrR family transcriptional regulator